MLKKREKSNRETTISKFWAGRQKTKVKIYMSLTANRYFGKSNTRHKLSKYLAGSNAISDLKAVNKHPDYDVEGVNVKNIKLERDSKTKDQGKVSRLRCHFFAIFSL